VGGWNSCVGWAGGSHAAGPAVPPHQALRPSKMLLLNPAVGFLTALETSTRKGVSDAIGPEVGTRGLGGQAARTRRAQRSRPTRNPHPHRHHIGARFTSL